MSYHFKFCSFCKTSLVSTAFVYSEVELSPFLYCFVFLKSPDFQYKKENELEPTRATFKKKVSVKSTSLVEQVFFILANYLLTYLMHCGQSEGRQIEERQREITVDPIYSNLHTLDGIIILVQVEYIIIPHVYIILYFIC